MGRSGSLGKKSLCFVLFMELAITALIAAGSGDRRHALRSDYGSLWGGNPPGASFNPE
jgi:hypothetical protein